MCSLNRRDTWSVCPVSHLDRAETLHKSRFNFPILFLPRYTLSRSCIWNIPTNMKYWQITALSYFDILTRTVHSKYKINIDCIIRLILIKQFKQGTGMWNLGFVYFLILMFFTAKQTLLMKSQKNFVTENSHLILGPQQLLSEYCAKNTKTYVWKKSGHEFSINDFCNDFFSIRTSIVFIRVPWRHLVCYI